MIGRCKSLLPLVLCLTLLLPAAALAAGLAEEVARDFQPVAGFLVMPMGEEFLIDLDAAKGIREGDLFAVVKTGGKVVHPVTKEVLGTLDEVKGYLQVSRVKSGYSYARNIGGKGGFEKGDRIQRFENLPALFWDYTGRGEGLYAELRAGLPQLDWRDYAGAQAARPESPRAPQGEPAALVFVLNENGLGVKDGAFNPLRFYPAAASLPAAAAIRPAAPPTSIQPTLPAAPLPVPAAPAAGIIVRPPQPLVASGGAIVRAGGRQEEGVWYSPEIKGEPVGLAVGDFDGDGRQETALAFPDRLEFSRLTGTELVAAGQVKFGSRTRAIALDSADLTGDGRPELYVTAADGKDLTSLVVEYSGGSYQATITRVPWYFRGVDLPGEGQILAGQAIGRGKNDFEGPVFRVARTGNDLRQGAEIPVPPFVSIYGFLPLADRQGTPIFANLSLNDNLQVLTPDGRKLWQSDTYFGGREAYIEREDPDVVRDIETRFVYLKARLLAGPAGELLVPVNEGSRLVSKLREFKSSQLKALVWDGFSLREAWATRPQGGYLADFQVADIDNDGVTELVMAILFTHGGMKASPRAALVVYELQ
jgi:hypothetical protein